MQADPSHVMPNNHAHLLILKLYVHLQGLNLDFGQLTHMFDEPGQVFDMARLIMALDELGFDARRESGGLGRLGQARLPVIAETREGGWMLVGRVDAQGVVVQRAGAEQPELLKRTDFEVIWGGAWVSAQRRTQGAAEADGGFGVDWFWYAISKHRAVLGEVLLASFFVQIFALVSPLVFQVIIDKVLTHRSMTTLDVMVVALLGVSLFEVILSAMRHYLFSHTTNRVDVELGAKLFKHLLHLPLAYFESRRSGDTVARVRELENARNFLTGQTLTAWLDLFFAGVFLAVMFYYSPILAWIVVAALPVFFGASLVITPILRKKLEDKFALGAENQAFLVETVTSMETLKGLAVEPHWQREWERRLADYVQAAFHGGHLANATNQFIGFASKVLTVALLWMGAKLVIDGELTVGGLIAFNMLAGRINAPILKLSSLWQDFTQMKVSITRLADIMDTPVEPAFRPDRATPPEITGRVVFDRVTFRYRPDGPEILSDVSFTVEPGGVIGLVGVSGAGKTTLMRLLQRLYTPERGRVTVDGIDLSLVDTGWLRRQIGVVSQDTVLFNRSVRDNIALADASLSMEAVMDAARLAGAHDFILELPEGYDTLIGDRGGKLSGGQRARIAIARALATNPRLLLLDEATAALDYESERAIHDNMAQICQGRTVFIVAHRLPTLRLAHRILVLDRGRLIEEGSHGELMHQGGRYHGLYKMHQVLEGAQHA
ncbi:MAG: type I secretion system permease/ATPase [Sulfuricella denitrificans]|nr:type I secretion system permease/ATPase [Sulfuricella denitrificans]